MLSVTGTVAVCAQMMLIWAICGILYLLFFLSTVHAIKLFVMLHGDEIYSVILVLCTSSSFFSVIDFFFNKVPEHHKGFNLSIVKLALCFEQK